MTSHSGVQCDAGTSPNRWVLSGWLIRHTRRLLPPLTFSVLSAVAGQLTGVAVLVLAAQAIGATVAASAEPFAPLMVLLVGLAMVKAVLFYLEHYAGHWVAFTALQRLRELFFARLIPQAPAATTGRAGAELTERGTRDIDRIEVFFAHTLPPAVAAVVVPAAVVTYLAATGESLLAFALVPGVLLLLVLPVVGARRSRVRSRDVAQWRAELAEHLGDDIQGAREVVAFGAVGSRLDSLAVIEAGMRSARGRLARQLALRTATATALRAGSVLLVMLVAGVTGAGISEMLSAVAATVALWAGSGGIDDFVTGLDDAFAATERVRAVIEARPAVTDPDQPRELPSEMKIVFDHVTFTYPGAQQPALRDVSLRVTAHQWNYIVGVSGSGKSTLAHVLLRGWDPQSGDVRFDTTSVRDISLDTLRTAVGYVSQRPTTVAGTIAENLLLACGSAPEVNTADTDARLDQALRAVALDEWVATLAAGVNTPLSERGLDLSGGQLQRLVIARALLAQPRVLVLDEALSQLDHASAVRVRTGIAGWSPGLTVVEITHRSDLIPDDDTVTVMDCGRAVESGTAWSLRRAGGAFTQLAARHHMTS